MKISDYDNSYRESLASEEEETRENESLLTQLKIKSIDPPAWRIAEVEILDEYRGTGSTGQRCHRRLIPCPGLDGQGLCMLYDREFRFIGWW